MPQSSPPNEQEFPPRLQAAQEALKTPCPSASGHVSSKPAIFQLTVRLTVLLPGCKTTWTIEQMPGARWNPRSVNASSLQTCYCLIFQIKLYSSSKHVLNKTVDKNKIKQKFNIACTLSVRLTFLFMSKDNKAIYLTCKRTGFFIARNTAWTELLHNYWAGFIHDCFRIQRCELVSENKSNINSWYVSWYLSQHHCKNCTAVGQKRAPLRTVRSSRLFLTAQTVWLFRLAKTVDTEHNCARAWGSRVDMFAPQHKCAFQNFSDDWVVNHRI